MTLPLPSVSYGLRFGSALPIDFAVVFGPLPIVSDHLCCSVVVFSNDSVGGRVTLDGHHHRMIDRVLFLVAGADADIRVRRESFFMAASPD